MPEDSFDQILALLSETVEAGDFDIHFARRNAPIGKGLGAKGVRNPGIVEEIRKALVWLGTEWTSLGFSRPDQRFPVYLYEWGDGGYPVPIVVWRSGWQCLLPSRTAKLDTQAELQYFRSTAVHEGTHCYCFQQKQFRPQGQRPRQWEWMAEGTSTWMEFRLMHEPSDLCSSQALEYWRDWCDYPELSLLTNGMYQCAPFLHYLTQRWGAEVISEVWRHKKTVPKAIRCDGDPFDIIRNLTGDTRLMPDYAVNAYFFGDPKSFCYAPAAARRYLSRGLTESAILEVGSTAVTISGSIQEAAVRYYALRVHGAQGVTIGFTAKPGNAKSECIATVTASDANIQRIGDSLVLTASPLPVPVQSNTDHLVIAVTVEPQSRENWVGLDSHDFEFVISRVESAGDRASGPE
jgi:hypothetical protein